VTVQESPNSLDPLHPPHPLHRVQVERGGDGAGPHETLVLHVLPDHPLVHVQRWLPLQMPWPQS
jgi:hypothetical protein